MQTRSQTRQLYLDMDITFCTFFYDIGRSDWSNFAIHSNTYMYWFKNVLSLDINLVIQTEEKFFDSIIEERKKVDPELKKTIVKICSIDKLPAWKKYNQLLEELMFSKNFKEKVHHDVPEMTRPLYNVLMFNKVFFLKEIIEQNPFDTKYFSWVDTGFIRDESWIISNQQWPDPEKLHLKENTVRFFCINNDVIKGLSQTTKESHCMSQMRYLKGTIFFLDGSCIDQLCQLFDKNVKQCITDSFIGSDEKIFDLCYCDNPDLFELTQCDWREEFHLYAKNAKRRYRFPIKWDIQDVVTPNAADYDFWYVGIEDSSTAVIHRCDFNPKDHPEICNHQSAEFWVEFESATKPHRVVIWPVGADKQWLKRTEYRLHL